jgi:putative transposase
LLDVGHHLQRDRFPKARRRFDGCSLSSSTSHVFPQAWTAILKTAGVTCMRTPAQSPNCNAHAERFVRTVRSECLNHFVIFGERHLRHLLREFTEHYRTERYHQGIGRRIIEPSARPRNDNATSGGIERRSRLGGVLNFYRRAA